MPHATTYALTADPSGDQHLERVTHWTPPRWLAWLGVRPRWTVESFCGNGVAWRRWPTLEPVSEAERHELHAAWATILTRRRLAEVRRTA